MTLRHFIDTVEAKAKEKAMEKPRVKIEGPDHVKLGDVVELAARFDEKELRNAGGYIFKWSASEGEINEKEKTDAAATALWQTAGVAPNKSHVITAQLLNRAGRPLGTFERQIFVQGEIKKPMEKPRVKIEGPDHVKLGDVVELAARFDEKELQEAGGYVFEWSASEGEINEKERTDSTAAFALWDTAGVAPDTYRMITVQLLNRAGRPLGTFERQIFVQGEIKKPSPPSPEEVFREPDFLTIRCPLKVVRGRVVTLRAEIKETYVRLVGKVEYKWHYTTGAIVEIEEAEGWSAAMWDTGSIEFSEGEPSSQTHKIRVTASDQRGNVTERSAEIVVDQDDELGPEERMHRLAHFLKANLDGRADQITGSLDNLAKGLPGAGALIAGGLDNLARRLPNAGDTFRVRLDRSDAPPTPELPLWAAIRNRTDAISFPRYQDFIDRLLCRGADQGQPADQRGYAVPPGPPQTGDYGEPDIRDIRNDLNTRPTIHGVDSYNLLKLATEAFLVFEAGVVVNPPRLPGTGQPQPANAAFPEEADRRGSSQPITFQQVSAALAALLAPSGNLRYLDDIARSLVGVRPVEALPYCDGILNHRLTRPSLLELIWSYWHEEGMLVQAMNAISLRFQNKRSVPGKDPLANLELAPLQPLNNLLWGFVQNEIHRLSVPRRAYEYDHHYGLTLVGKAVPTLRTADSRSKFLEAFHNLLYRTHVFYQEDADTTVIADAFPLLNALREIQLLLAEGAHNQFGDLPWTARAEMLMQQWLLARPEMRLFLRGRLMAPYAEGWMGAVDDMKRYQGWTDVSVTHFNELATAGERLLLSIRYFGWNTVNNQNLARNWARYWKPEIQRYIFAYRAVTGADLTSEPVDSTLPSVLLRNRLAAQARVT